MITFVNVFTVKPEQQQAALEAIAQVYREAVKLQPGFISAKLLKSNDGTRVTAIALWETEADLKAMRTTQKFKDLHDPSFSEKIVSVDSHVYDSVIEIE